jgi:hypothetical protein
MQMSRRLEGPGSLGVRSNFESRTDQPEHDTHQHGGGESAIGPQRRPRSLGLNRRLRAHGQSMTAGTCTGEDTRCRRSAAGGREAVWQVDDPERRATLNLCRMGDGAPVRGQP